MTGRFEGKVAIVTGGALGIGGATARRFAAEGAKVLIADFNPQAAEQNVRSITDADGIAVASSVDVSKSADLERMVQEATDRWGRLDILVQNAFSVTAGDTRIKGSAEKVSEQDWDWGMAVLAKALYLGAKFAVPHMRKSGGGSIINVASIHSYFAEAGMLAYEAGKAAAVAITKQLAVEYGPDNIRVNAVGPGHIVSEGFVEMWKQNPDGLKFFEAQYPVRRTGTPDDVAGPILFLCSDDASFITGHTLMVDGGLTVQLQEQFGLRQACYALDNPGINLPD